MKNPAHQVGDLTVRQVEKHTYLHISYLQTEQFGRVGCNGMIAVDGREAIIFDTPVDNENAGKLIDWVEHELNKKIIGVVVTHFHTDCLGGLPAFHEKGIPSFACTKTIELAK
ncbi:MAG: MBL fold metallo-hydrolase, partial [Saprospiraceae bacterium]|nr:MBL fold metallo-hydrolase [Saprospiraceae bacterium]